MKTRTLQLPATIQGDLILVNASHPLPEGFAPRLGPLACDGAGQTLLATTAAKMLDICVTACGAYGMVLPVSGYRSRAEQTAIYQDTLAREGGAFTRKYVALPGCSEHETGLAVDLAGAGSTPDPVRPNLPDTGVYRRFRECAADYGFVLRYPAHKTGVTGIGYEPWHFRYVGWPHAKIMVEKDLVLEEYIQLLQLYNSPDIALTYSEGGRRVSIFTQKPPAALDTAALLTSKGCLWQSSGNNAGGLVVTVWS